MKCFYCELEDKKSTLHPGPQTTTCMSCPSYFDEEGVWHSHDSNKFTTCYTCSNGHAYKEVTYRVCPAKGCDFNGDKVHERHLLKEPTPNENSSSF